MITEQDLKRQRELMISQQIMKRGIRNPDVVKAFLKVPRHHFLSKNQWQKAYGDFPVQLIKGQTISQPYMVAIMTDYLSIHKSDSILEIGTGSGYQTAILAELAAQVYTIELIQALYEQAKKKLYELFYKNIQFYFGDGTLGWPEQIKFNKIIVTAAAPKLPDSLISQLSDNGKLVIPIGKSPMYQDLYIIKKTGSHLDMQRSIGCRFVPLKGKNGW